MGGSFGAEVDSFQADWAGIEEWRQLLSRHSRDEGELDSESIKMKWLVATLSDLYERRNEVADPLGEVEGIYSDFDYPECIEGFVRYMPTSDGYDASKFSRNENEQRLFLTWSEFISKGSGNSD
jgi:hypothetical protein